MTTKIEGQLEIDHERGVVWFHSKKTGTTIFRVCKLPIPLPQLGEFDMIDVVTQYAAVMGPDQKKEPT